MSFLRQLSDATRTHAVVAREFSPTMLNAFPLRKRSMTRICFFCFFFSSLVLRSSLTRFVNSCAPADSYTALILRLAFPPDPATLFTLTSFTRCAVLVERAQSTSQSVFTSPLSRSLRDGAVLLAQQKCTSAVGNLV